MPKVWLSKFADQPALLAPLARERIEASLLAIDDRLAVELAAVTRADAGQDDFWTELGPRGSRVLRPYLVNGGVLQIPIRGILLNGFPYQLYDFATGYEYIAKALERGLADDAVKGIALIIDSPGGMVAGNFDLVDRIYASRGTKPIRAFTAENAFSAAYSIASAAETITVPRTGEVGSIGVVLMHVDISGSLEDAGIKVTFVYAGKHKVEGNSFEPLSAEVKARWQEDIDYLYGIFVDTAARNRGLTPDAVRATEADTFRADEALNNGLADAIGAFADALAMFEADVNNPDQGDETMSDAKPAVTVASVKADHPEVANALIGEGRSVAEAAAQAATQTAVTQAVSAERVRVKGLDGLLAKMGGSPKATEIVSAAKEDGSTVEATAVKLIDAGVAAGAQTVAALAADDASAAGAKPAGTGAGGAQVAQTPAGWTAEWEANATLKEEFATAADYVGWKQHEAKQPKKEGK